MLAPHEAFSFAEKKVLALSHNVLNPHAKIIAIAGTNGKGSMAYALEALAIAANIDVLCFTSPHLCDWTERIRFNGQNIAHNALTAYYDQVSAWSPRLRFFDMLFFSMLLYAKDCKPALIIIEAGIGARQDITNMLDPDVSVLTSVGADHQAILGKTLAAITREKCGYMREAAPFFCADNTVFDLVSEEAKKTKAALHCFSMDYPTVTFSHVTMPKNILSTAVAVWRESYPAFDLDFEKVLMAVVVPGRCQIIEYCGKTFLLDVAHNPEACAYLRAFMTAKAVHRVSIVCQFKQDKQAETCLRHFAGLAKSCVLLNPLNEQMMTPEKLAPISEKSLGISPKLCTNLEDALHYSMRDVSAGEMVLVFGSFSLVGAVLEVLHGL